MSNEYVHTVSLPDFDYEVWCNDYVEEFTVNRLQWSVAVRAMVPKQLGDPIPIDRPLAEYGPSQYDDMVHRALEQEADFA